MLQRTTAAEPRLPRKLRRARKMAKYREYVARASRVINAPDAAYQSQMARAYRAKADYYTRQRIARLAARAALLAEAANIHVPF